MEGVDQGWAEIEGALRRVARERPDALERGERVRALLNDALGSTSVSLRNEVALVTAAVDDGIVADLRRASTPVAAQAAAARLVEAHHVSTDSATRAVEAWLSVIAPDRVSTDPEPTDVVDSVFLPSEDGDHEPTPGDLTPEPRRPPSDPVEPADPDTGDTPEPKRRTWIGIAAAAIVALLGVILIVVLVAGGGGGASGASASRRDVAYSGLDVRRTWSIEDGEPRHLAANVVLENNTDHAISVTHSEPLPTDSVRKIRFTVGSGSVDAGDGIARDTTKIAPNRRVAVRYSGEVVPKADATAKQQLATVKREIAASLASAEPTGGDLKIADPSGKYGGAGAVKATEESGNVTLTSSLIGKTYDVTVDLTPKADDCRLPSAPCAYVADDNWNVLPAAYDLAWADNRFVAEMTSTLGTSDDGALTCGGNPVPTGATARWSIAPTDALLTWSGWFTTKVRYDRTLDRSFPAGSSCRATNYHLAYSGELERTS